MMSSAQSTACSNGASGNGSGNGATQTSTTTATTTVTTASTQSAAETKNGYQVPKWASKPPSGLHLDVMKEGKMIQKLMIDEKRYYFFGRNKDTCDFITDHASCSRVHAVLMWHKHLNRSFLVDLGSTHGTFIGSLRLEGHKPQQVFVDSELKFGASTRTYVIRERPQVNKQLGGGAMALQQHQGGGGANTSMNTSGGELNESERDDASLLHLPECEAELDNLTEFNTAHNKRIAQLVDISSATGAGVTVGAALVRRKRKSVVFRDDIDIINPEDVDPSVGRFRNMVQSSVIIPNKKRRSNQMEYSGQFQATMAGGVSGNASVDATKRARSTATGSVDIDETLDEYDRPTIHGSPPPASAGASAAQRRLYDDDNNNDDDNNTNEQDEYDNADVDENSDDEPATASAALFSSRSVAMRLGIPTLDLAPDVDNYAATEAGSTLAAATLSQQQMLRRQRQQQHEYEQQQQKQARLLFMQQQHQQQEQQEAYDREYAHLSQHELDELSRKKKYAKEAWPGRKPPVPLAGSSSSNSGVAYGSSGATTLSSSSSSYPGRLSTSPPVSAPHAASMHASSSSSLSSSSPPPGAKTTGSSDRSGHQAKRLII